MYITWVLLGHYKNQEGGLTESAEKGHDMGSNVQQVTRVNNTA